jgi:predicted phosphoribosyltransferase
LYRRGHPAVELRRRCVIVVDDGIATGSTVLAAISALRNAEPSHLVLAVPIASPEAVRSLSLHVDEMICLHSPVMFHAVGQAYADFGEVSDEDVIALLDELHPRTT